MSEGDVSNLHKAFPLAAVWQEQLLRDGAELYWHLSSPNGTAKGAEAKATKEGLGSAFKAYTDLKDFVNALTTHQKVVPYSAAPLTWLMQDASAGAGAPASGEPAPDACTLAGAGAGDS